MPPPSRRRKPSKLQVRILRSLRPGILRMEARFFRSQAAEVTGTAERMFLLAMAERLERRADASMYEG